MKKKYFYSIFSISIITILLLVALYFIFDTKTFREVQDLDYSESLEYVANPDQGFYRTSYVAFYPEKVEKSLSMMEDFQLYHLRMDISAFSSVVNGESDLVLTDQALVELENVIDYYKQNGKNVIIRFSYDTNFEGHANYEPDVNMILTHIEQICPILNKFTNTITAIEVGMVGPWGEMHTSTIANADTINKLIDKYLKSTSDIPILVRTPKMIYDYLGITIDNIQNYTIEENSLAYRLGLFNDGYLGSSSDLGTYTDRETETTWLSKQTEHLPYGGEVTSPDSDLHNIEVCTPEMFKLNLSYLNYEWNYNVVQDKWQNTYYTKDCGDETNYYNKTAFQYIQNRLGYRLVLKESLFSYDENFKNIKIELNIKNVGFGNLNRQKDITVLFVNDDNKIYSFNAGTYSGQEKIDLNIPLNIGKDNYDVYLKLSTIENEENLYPIKFANNDIYSEALNANYIGKIKF